MLKKILVALAGLAMVIGFAAPAQAVTGYPDQFTVTNGSKGPYAGVTVMKLPSSASPNAYTDRFASNLGLWGGMTVWVCVTAAAPSGTNSVQISSIRLSDWLTFSFSSTNLVQKCKLTYNNIGANQSDFGRFYLTSYGYGGQTNVRTVDIYPY